MFKTTAQDNVWLPVPEWFTGKFHSDIQKITLFYYYRTGRTISAPIEDAATMKEVSNVTKGEQRSKDGQYWNYVKIPGTQIADIEVGKAYVRSVREELISISKSELVMRYTYFDITVSRAKKIISTKQVQAVNTYTPMDDNKVLMKASIKQFSDDGEPFMLQHGEKVLTRTSPFHEVDKQHGINLKQLFVEFLTKTGRADLIP